MSNIQTYLDEIQNALYGEEVRSSIINAINQCYQDATDGIKPEITFDTIANGTTVTIKIGNETNSFDVLNGAMTEFETRQYTGTSVTCGAESSGNSSVTIDIPDGYSFIAVIDTWSNGEIVNVYTNTATVTDGGQVTLYWNNPSSYAKVVTFTANVLFAKRGQETFGVANNEYPTSTLDVLTTQVIYNAAMSYHMHAWSVGSNNTISYGNYLTNNSSGHSMTALDPPGSGTVYDKIDCSTFVLLCLMGIPFKDSPYNGREVFAPVTNFERFFDIDSERNPTGRIRWASELLKYAESNGLMYRYTDPKQIKTGDVVFYIWNDDKWAEFPSTSFAKKGKGAYRHCAHVGMLISGCTMDVYTDGVGIVQCVSTSAVMDMRPWGEYNPSTLHLYPYIMRPNLRVVGDVWARGLWKFRSPGDRTNPDKLFLNYYMNSQAVRFSGNRIPSNAFDFGLTSGAPDNTKTGRLTTYYIPYSSAIVIEGVQSGTQYVASYYDSNKTYSDSTTNTINRTKTNTAYIRLSFESTTNNGVLTSDQKQSLIDNVVIRYHNENMQYSRDENIQTTGPSYTTDSVFYFESPTRINPQVVLG